MATPYFPEDIGEEELYVPRLPLCAESYELIQERARRLGIEPLSEVMTYALSLFVGLTSELENGTRFLVQRGGTTGI